MHPHRGFFMPVFDRILQLARMEEMDCEFVEVTAHEGARPTHAVWQGRVYHRGGAVVHDGERYEDFETATGYGTGPGLCGWNCRHNFYPFYPGVSVRNYTDERLAELDARNIPYGGGLYTRYEITQMQRALERRVRKYKRRYLAETAAGVDASQSAAKLKAARQQLSAFLEETGERLDGARAEVPGKNFSAKKQTAYAARKEQSALQKLNFADNVSQTERESIEKELSVIPKWQKNRVESIIDKVVMVDRNASGSGYSYKSRTLYVHPDRTAGDMIHEYGHALEISLKLIHNEKYIGMILKNQGKGGYELRLYNKSGKVVLSKEFKGDYSHVKLCGNQVIMYDGKNCSIFMKNGIQKFKGRMDNNILEMFPVGGVNQYIVLSANGMEKVRLVK